MAVDRLDLSDVLGNLVPGAFGILLASLFPPFWPIVFSIPERFISSSLVVVVLPIVALIVGHITQSIVSTVEDVFFPRQYKHEFERVLTHRFLTDHGKRDRRSAHGRKIQRRNGKDHVEIRRSTAAAEHL